MDDNSILCTICKLPISCVNAFKLHLKISHSLECIKVYNCAQKYCCQAFSNWTAFRRHLVNFHRLPVNEPILDNASSLSCHMFTMQNDDTPSNISTGDLDISDESMNELPVPTSNSLKTNLSVSLLTFLGKLYASPKLPRSHVQTVFESTKDLISDILSEVEPAVCTAIESNSLSCESLVCAIKAMFDSVSAPFDAYSSEHKRLKALADTGCLTYPKTFEVGDIVEEKRKDGRIVKTITPVTAQFVPLRTTLQSFFNLPGVLDTILNYMNALESDNSGVLTNFVQGTLWQKKKMRFPAEQIVVPLFLYYDDFEVNNPLGSHRNIQKIGGTYFSIPCMPPEYQTALENIFLTMLFHTSDRATFHNSAVFRILVNELNYLEKNGITFTLPSGEKTVHFALGLFLGDNLGINQALGYVEGFNANYFCRLCKVKKDETKVAGVENVAKIRDPESYTADVQLGPSRSGVKENSVWNEVSSFHVYENFIVDIGHDLFEGVLKYDMAHIVNHFVKKAEKKVSLHILNDRLKTFDYYKHEISNKPPLISEEELKNMELVMCASEMLNFTIIFALLVSDLISHDEVWHFYLLLRKILNIVLSTSLQNECAPLLNCLVKEHHDTYQKLFSDTLKPKHHHMVHYGRILLASGPLCYLSSMKFESKHRIFKNRANATSSRKNITYTLALKEQLQFSFRLLGREGLVSKLDLGPSSFIKLSDFQDYPNTSLPLGFQKNDCVEVPWVDYKGTKYRVGSCVTLSYNNEEAPVFGEIDKIFCDEGQIVCILCHVFDTLGLDENLVAYEVKPSGNVMFTLLKDLLSPRPAILVQRPYGTYVTLKQGL